MIERFDWTDHAERRLREREFHRINVEMAIRLGHDGRSRNDGPADWLVLGQRRAGRQLRSFSVTEESKVTEERYAYWDREADIVWIPTAPAEFVTSEELSWGLVDHDKKTGEVTALELWNASKALPIEMIERLPSPGRPKDAAA